MRVDTSETRVDTPETVVAVWPDAEVNIAVIVESGEHLVVLTGDEMRDMPMTASMARRLGDALRGAADRAEGRLPLGPVG